METVTGKIEMKARSKREVLEAVELLLDSQEKGSFKFEKTGEAFSLMELPISS